MPKEVAVYDAVVERGDVRREDGGAALIIEVPGADAGTFVRLQSWTEPNTDEKHPGWMLNAVGKRVSVRVEVLDA